MTALETWERSPELSELKLSYKRRPPRRGVQTATEPILNAQATERYLRAVWNNDTLDLVEDFLVVCLNPGHVPLGWVRASTGSFNRALVDPRIIFGMALQTASSAIIVAHNHPSGSVQPSPEDRSVTARLSEAGRLLNIALLDHIILARTGMFSFAEDGTLSV